MFATRDSPPEIRNDHLSLVVKVAKSFCKNTKYCSAKSKFRYLLSVESQVTRNAYSSNIAFSGTASVT